MWKCNEAENVSRNGKEEGETDEVKRLLSVMIQKNLQEVRLAGEHEHPARNLGHVIGEVRSIPRLVGHLLF